MPRTCEEAVTLAEAGALALTEKITVRSMAGEKYDKVISHVLGEISEPAYAENNNDEDLPF